MHLQPQLRSEVRTIAQHISLCRDTAAVASSRAGELYGLQVLDEGIQDNKDNVTRFLVLSRDPCTSVPGDARPFKTSIVFAMPERAGQLFKVRLR